MGSSAVQTMTNLTIREFKELYGIIEHSLKEIRRDPKSKLHPIDRLFLLLVTFKFYEKWDRIAINFGFKTSTIEKAVMDTIERKHEPITERLTQPMSMEKQN